MKLFSSLVLLAFAYIISDMHPVATATLAVAASTAEPQISQSTIGASAGQGMLSVFPFSVGTSWVYHAVIDTGTPDKPKYFEGAITETIISATAHHKNWLFHSRISGYSTPDSAIDHYYVINGTGLYELADANSAASATDSETMVNYAYAQILAWPLEVGQMMGDPAFMNAEGRNVWLVQAIGSIDGPAGHFTNCYLISLLTNPDDTHRWFCPSVGFVQHEYHHHGSRDDEFWQLTALKMSF